MTEVRQVTPEDGLADAFAVRREVFVREQGVSENEEMDGRDDEAAQFVAYDDDYPIGTARLRTVEGDESGGAGTGPAERVGKVERVAVRVDYRGQGVGRALMDRVESRARSAGFDALELHAQTHVEAFYGKLGYETTSGVFQEAGIDHVAMRKSLADPDVANGGDAGESDDPGIDDGGG